MPSKQLKMKRKARQKAKKKNEGGFRKPEPPVEDARNLLRIGGTIGSIRTLDAEEREGRIWRAVELRCEYGPKRVIRPWVNVYDSFSEFIAELARGEPVSLAGYIRSLKEPHPVTHQMWELYVNQLLCTGRTNPDHRRYHACNEIRARGFITYCRARTVGKHENHACEFGLRCDIPGRGSNLIEMIAFYRPEADITAIIERWPRRRELAVAARVNTYGENYSVTNIVATDVLLGPDEEVPTVNYRRIGR